ncbi:MAG TPA: hypothetical protein VEX11_00620 [Acetobacteraceae bacterium]|nr:hypothetical protein [Acetobacteraceae bacterium]
MDVFLLAKNAGTRSDMIERFYGQVKLERMVKELRPEWRTVRADGGSWTPPGCRPPADPVSIRSSLMRGAHCARRPT